LVSVLKDRRRRHAQDGDTLSLKPSITPLIMRDLGAFTMGCAVDLDRELRRGTEEIEDVRARGMLVPENEHAWPAPLQARPKHEFRRGQGSAKSLRAL
jgi:hypothetical protein